MRQYDCTTVRDVSWVVPSNAACPARSLGGPAADLAVQTLDGATDQLPYDFRLVVRLIELGLFDIGLIQGHIQVTLDFLGGPERNVEEAPLVFERIAAVPSVSR